MYEESKLSLACRTVSRCPATAANTTTEALTNYSARNARVLTTSDLVTCNIYLSSGLIPN